MLNEVLRHVVFPFHERVVRRRKIWRHRRFLEASQWWSRDQLLAFQWQELQKLLHHADAQSPYWREAFRRAGTTPGKIRSYQDFRALPPLTKTDIRRHRADMVARDHIGRTWVKSTSGSTGEPFAFDYTRESYDWRVAISRRGYAWAGYEEGMKQVSIWGAFTIGRRPAYLLLKDRLRDRMAGRILVNFLKWDERTLDECFNLINRYKPVNIVGYTNPLHRFAQYVESRGGFEVPIRSAISAAEKLHDYQRRDIEAAFKCPVFETYGSREVMLIGAECEHKTGLHLSVENVFVEVIDDRGQPAKPGETGELVITDLHNYGMPFIRYRMGDLAVVSNEVCPCGRGLPLVRELKGRTLDVIRTRAGATVPGEFFPHVFKEFKEVAQYQVVQDDLDHLVVKIVKTASFTEAVRQRIHSELVKMFGDTLTIAYEFVDAIPLTPSGKLRVTVSNIASTQV
jgi:phenylacetate-CoA ligase